MPMELLTIPPYSNFLNQVVPKTSIKKTGGNK